MFTWKKKDEIKILMCKITNDVIHAKQGVLGNDPVRIRSEITVQGAANLFARSCKEVYFSPEKDIFVTL